MIVVGGEALVDLVPERSTAPPELAPLVPRLGGGPYNVAVALGRLGSAVSMLTRISTDHFGQSLVDRLRKSGVDTSLVRRGAEPTTTALATTGPDGSARYVFHVHGTADRLVADPGPLPDDVRAVALGTLSLVLEPGASAYEAVLHRESARGRVVALDPNIRADLIEDADAYRARFDGWLADVDLLKVSAEDACWLADEDDPMPAVQRWAKCGPAAVVLTRGADGLVAVTRDGTVAEVPRAESAVVDTIGAGDTAQAALLHWLDVHGLLDRASLRAAAPADWAAALSFAARAAAVTCSRPGAEPPWAAELA